MTRVKVFFLRFGKILLAAIIPVVLAITLDTNTFVDLGIPPASAAAIVAVLTALIAGLDKAKRFVKAPPAE